MFASLVRLVAARELEEIKLKTMSKKNIAENPNLSVLSNNIEDLSQIITVRVSLKTGIHKWDMNEVSSKLAVSGSVG